MYKQPTTAIRDTKIPIEYDYANPKSDATFNYISRNVKMELDKMQGLDKINLYNRTVALGKAAAEIAEHPESLQNFINEVNQIINK